MVVIAFNDLSKLKKLLSCPSETKLPPENLLITILVQLFIYYEQD